MIVQMRQGPVLVDREALSMLTNRTVNTIRMRCEVVKYVKDKRGKRAMYDLEREVARLEAIPRRRRDDSRAAS